MKNLLLLLITFVFFTNVQAQRTIAFETQYKEDYKGYAAMLSIPNEIIVMIQGVSCDNILLTTNNGTIERTEKDCKWNYVPHKQTIATISVNEIVNGDTILFCKQRLYIKPWRFIPTLGRWIPEKNETLYLTKEEIKTTRLAMESINTNLSAYAPIMNFEVHIIRNKELLYTKRFKKMNRAIHDEYHKQFEHLRKGDIVEFTENVQ